ncbi:acyl-CoA N-acyltransferase [Mycena rosella]|uniref:Acyl-CoA N-acyltransferase n=1 Tax=Mycena rosella TaxID=1033263 RepID=A0AAD7C9Q6_MYCRO|nr:acyl-CoA N-acyltransferase [Mycena rosella]
MAAPQFSPLDVNPETGELFLRLPHPHATIILTPPRTRDAEPIVDIMNDPAVYPFLGRPKMPYLLEAAVALVAENKHASDAVIKALEDAAPDAFAEDCPVSSIREVLPDGTEVYIGSIRVKRCNWWEVQGAQRVRLMEQNAGRATGDPETVWQVSDYVASSHHRRGIMTAVLRTFLDQWAIPRMGVRHLHVSVFTGNEGSVRVFEKTGFVLVDTLENCIEIRGEMRGLHVMDWHHSGYSAALVSCLFLRS